MSQKKDKAKAKKGEGWSSFIKLAHLAKALFRKLRKSGGGNARDN